MLDKQGNRFCCWINGYGRFEEEAPEWMDLFSRTVPGWITNQGKFQITLNEWAMDAGIPHHDEEWRITNDIKAFRLENHTFLHQLAHGAQSYLHIGINDSAMQGTCELDGATLALLSSLRIGLTIDWGYSRAGKEHGAAETAPSG